MNLGGDFSSYTETSRTMSFEPPTTSDSYNYSGGQLTNSSNLFLNFVNTKPSADSLKGIFITFFRKIIYYNLMLSRLKFLFVPGNN